jgi:HNH endonuclease
MRIALRTSGGRGEYELAGSHDGYTTASLYDKQIVLEITPDVQLPTGNFVRDSQGKRRIRLGDQRLDTHIYLLVAALLLLPKPIRQLSETGDGHLQLMPDHYSVQDIHFDIVRVTHDTLVIRPTYVKLSNTSESKYLDVAERMQLLLGLWDKAESSGEVSATLLRAHATAYNSSNARDLIQAATGVRAFIHSEQDPLRQLLHEYQLSSTQTVSMGVSDEVNADLSDANPTSIDQASLAFVRKLRLIADRGAGGAAFRRDVKLAYNHTCLFSGLYLPSTPLTGSTGVDAAHILPWAKHNINVIQNGICLNKLAHWAFDANILRLDFDEASRTYSVSVREAIKSQESLLELAPFLAMEGVIPRDRLPHNTSLWPGPEFIKHYNEGLPS